MEQTEKLTGTISDVIYRNEESGYTIVVVEINNDEDDLVKIVGESLPLEKGDSIQAEGKYVTHPEHGLQFKAHIICRAVPSTASSIRQYLSSGAIKGIGKSLAKEIVDKFGDKTLEIMGEDPMRLTEIHGIGAGKAAKINASYMRMYGISTLAIFLARYGINSSKVTLAWKKWKAQACDLIKENPYLLTTSTIAVSFEIADNMGSEFDIPKDAYCRVSAGVVCVLRDHGNNNGHTCYPLENTINEAHVMLNQPSECIEEVVDIMRDEESVFVYPNENDGVEYLYLPDLFNDEQYIAGRLSIMMQLQGEASEKTVKSIKKQITDIENELGIEYDDLQKKAILSALTNNLFVLTGGPGTGKTTTVNGILTMLQKQELNVMLAAPTGRAAKRMSDVTGQEAKTIHRLLEISNGAEGFVAKRNQENTLPADVVIVDEVSMLDVTIMASLLRGIKMNVKLILIGDYDQLPSVLAGNVLKDIIQSDVVPTIHLSQVFRQAAESLIVTNAHSIVNGDMPVIERQYDDSDFFFVEKRTPEGIAKLAVDLCHKRLSKRYDLSPLWDIQVITPTKKGASGTVELNKVMQAALNPPHPTKNEAKFGGRIFREGDKIMQIRNNYDMECKSDNGLDIMGVFNGDIGVVEEIDNDDKKMRLRFDDKVANYPYDSVDQLLHAFAITVHKSQGSEFEAVVMLLNPRWSPLNYRNLLYTGVTRAKQVLVLIGSSEILSNMVYNDQQTLRYTNLKDILADAVITREAE